MKEKDANLFTEGAIYFYENNTNTKSDYKDETLNHDFLVSRPVYVLRKRETPFDEFTINVFVITSSTRRIGVPININGYKNGKILPYAIHSVHKEYLTKYMGQATPEIIEEVRRCELYHLGFSDDKPEYLTEYEEYERKHKELLNSFTLKEKGVYEFISDRCAFNDSFYVSASELYGEYIKAVKDNCYTRPQDFGKCLNNILHEFPGVERRVSNKIVQYKGMSIFGRIHKKEIKVKNQRRCILDKNSIDEDAQRLEDLPNDKLYNLMTEKSQKAWRKMSLLEKLDNYNKSPKDLIINNYDEQDAKVLKRMIVNDVNVKKDKVLRTLDNGANPLSMNTMNQYVLYICSNEEILNHISHRYLKRGGIGKVRNGLRNNVKHYFLKI